MLEVLCSSDISLNGLTKAGCFERESFASFIVWVWGKQVNNSKPLSRRKPRRTGDSPGGLEGLGSAKAMRLAQDLSERWLQSCQMAWESSGGLALGHGWD